MLDDGPLLWGLLGFISYLVVCIAKGEVTRWHRSRILKRDRDRRERMRREFDAEYQGFSRKFVVWVGIVRSSGET